MSNRRLAKLVSSLFSPAGRRARLAVFCYHQVLNTHDEIRTGEPTSAEFAQDVKVIDGVFNVLSFAEAVQRLVSNSLPKRAACITFDDGYENNYSLAAPILEKAGVPATFFVAVGAVDEGVVWNDLVIEAVAHSVGALKVSDEFEFLKLPDPDAAKSDIVATLLAKLKYKPMNERWEISSRLYLDNVGGDLPRLMMTREMVRDLSIRGFEIGGHTIDHPILRELPDEEARQEILGCKDWVQTVTESAPTSFAYPNGKTGVDFDDRHLKMVADAGFSAACSTDWDLARINSNPYNVPRIGPWWRQGRSLESGLVRAYIRSYI